MPNTHFPLHFERLGGTHPDPELEYDGRGSNIPAEVSALEMHGRAAFSCKEGKKVYEATVKALEAHAYTDRQKAIECAREALAVSSFFVCLGDTPLQGYPYTGIPLNR
jgi:hypothetical protein